MTATTVPTKEKGARLWGVIWSSSQVALLSRSAIAPHPCLVTFGSWPRAIVFDSLNELTRQYFLTVSFLVAFKVVQILTDFKK